MQALAPKRRMRRSREERGVLAGVAQRTGRNDFVALPDFERNRAFGRREDQGNDIVARLEPFALEKGRRRSPRPRTEIACNGDPCVALRVAYEIVGCQKALLALAGSVAGRRQFGFE
jgi:hypothetical protein